MLTRSPNQNIARRRCSVRTTLTITMNIVTTLAKSSQALQASAGSSASGTERRAANASVVRLFRTRRLGIIGRRGGLRRRPFARAFVFFKGARAPKRRHRLVVGGCWLIGHLRHAEICKARRRVLVAREAGGGIFTEDRRRKKNF